MRRTIGAGLLNPVLALDAVGEAFATLEVDLKGESRFEPNPLVDAYIDGSGDAGAQLRVRYGHLAHGRMVIRVDDNGFQADETFLDFSHPDLVPRDGKRLVLAVEIQNGEITGRLGAYAQTLAIRAPGSRYTLADEDLFPMLFGRSYTDLASLDLVDFHNELANGELRLSTGFILTPPDGPQISGGLALIDSAFAFGANSKLDVSGLQPMQAPITRTRSGLLLAQIPDLDISREWSGHGFTGSVKASYVDGTFLASGRLTFRYPSAKPRLTGEVSVIVTSSEDAWAWARSRDPAPTLTGGLHPTGYAKQMALAGSGVLRLEIAPKVSATASFVVDPDGYVTAKGVLRTDNTYEIYKKSLTGKELADWKQRWVLPVAHAPLFLGVSADAKMIVELVPSLVFLVSLRELAVTGLYSTRPNTGTQLDIEGSLNLSATAGLHASAMLEGSVNLGWDVTIPYINVNLSVKPIAVSVGVAGDAVLKAYADIHPKIRRSTVADPSADEAEYTIAGHLEAGGKFELSLGAADGFDFLGFWKPRFRTGTAKYELGGGAIALDFKHVIGKDEKPTVKFTRPSFDPSKFVADIEAERSRNVRDRFRGSAAGPGAKATPVHDTNTAPRATPEQKVELEVPFEAEHHPHHLYLVFPHQGDPPRVDLATHRERLSSKLERSATNVKFALVWFDDPEKRKLGQQQIVDLMNLALEARQLEGDAARLGGNPDDLFESELPELAGLAQKLAKYAERYDDPELDGETHVGKEKIEQPVVGPEHMLDPTTHADVLDAEIRQWIANHEFVMDPVTKIFTRTMKGTVQRLAQKRQRWTLSNDAGVLQEEYDVRRYGNASTGGEGMFQAHHLVQDYWAKHRLQTIAKSALRDPSVIYQPDDEPTILLRDSFVGSPHYLISRRQSSRKSTAGTRTYKAERAETDIDLSESNVPPDFHDLVNTRADAYFKLLHDNITDDAVRRDLFEDYFKP